MNTRLDNAARVVGDLREKVIAFPLAWRVPLQPKKCGQQPVRVHDVAFASGAQLVSDDSPVFH